MTRVKKKRGKFRLFCAGIIVLGVFFLINWFYHAVHKPSEIIGLVDGQFFKNPEETWDAYGKDFGENSTNVISSELLAALAQTESQGNSIARTYWQWNFWTKNPFKIYSPASSAVGMLQMTNGTFDQARQYCIINNRVFSNFGKEKRCSMSSLYNRLIPSHSIEMTSAWLHVNVQEIIQGLPKKKFKKVSDWQKKQLAAVVHLCGKKRASEFANRRFSFKRGETCGALDARKYVAKVLKYEKVFRKIKSARSRELAFN